MENETIAKPSSSTKNAFAIGGLGTLTPLIVKLFYPLGDKNAADYSERLLTQEIIIGIIIFLIPFIIHLLLLFTNRYVTTPEEMDKTRKLKKDLKELEKILDDSQKNPHRYSPEKINEYRKEYQETRAMLARIGRDSLHTA